MEKKTVSKKINFSVGDEVISYLRHSSVGKVAVRGKIKKIVGEYGRKTYLISEGVLVGEFPTRTIKKIRK